MIVGSLFSGIGGIDLGFAQAGFDIAWAVENNHSACETYRANFPTTTLIEADIRKVNAATLSPVDVIVAGFPCQAFSIGGKQQGFQDSRGNLFFELARFIREHQPRFVFMENVANLLEHDDGRTFLVMYNTLNALGYCLRYCVMRASDYGNVPQIRDRIYLVAFKDVVDCDRFAFPTPVKLCASVDSVIDRTKPARSLYYYVDDSPFAQKARKIVVNKNTVYRVYHDSIKPIQNGLCPTLTASMGTQRNQVPLILDDYGVRKITPYECLRFQGFPANFIFGKSITVEDAYQQIGNSVCVPVVQRIAEAICNILV